MAEVNLQKGSQICKYCNTKKAGVTIVDNLEKERSKDLPSWDPIRSQAAITIANGNAHPP